jgi:subtilase family protein
MPERPLLILPAPGERPVRRQQKRSRDTRFHRPSHERQFERLTPRFEQLQRTLETRRTRLQTEAHGLVPEEVIVLETVGTVEDFIGAVEKVPGMEWLSEIEEEDIPPDDDFFALGENDERRPGKPLRGRLFMIFTSQDAFRQMLSLWASWRAGRKLPYGLGRWRALFEQLRDVRPWGVRDRLLETGVLDDWQERLGYGQEVVPCEIELWYRQKPRQRRRARDRVSDLVAELGGEIVNEAVIEEIAYHALLAKLPIGSIRSLLDSAENEAELVQCEQIQFFRASGQMAAELPEDERQQDENPIEGAAPVGQPIVALFDGLPLQGHRRLEGRLIVDDPDDFEAEYPADERRHGTSMASLILHGDLAAGETALARPLYVRPILRPDAREWMRGRQETVAEDALVVDLLHRAVRRLFEGEGTQAPVAPDISVINLSIGIRDRPFDGSLSPLARLLDWLSWRYQVLFVVSVGNHSHRIEVNYTGDVLSTLAPVELQDYIVRAVAADARRRRLLSPAEGLNALAVGAVHDDASGSTPPARWSHPYIDRGLPSPINAQGMGYRRSVKPDLLAPGGRIMVQEYLGSTTYATLNVYKGTLPPGQVVSAPGRTAGDRNATCCTRGTSNATALVSRGAALLHDVLAELRTDPGGEIIDTIPPAVWLKALLAHSAEWRTAGPVLDRILRTAENSRQFKEYVTRLLGYGSIDIARVRECTAFRATALGGGFLAEDQSHIHRFPLPPALSGQRGYRRLTITLAWLTPVNPRHQSWRRADLWFSPPKDELRVERRQADWRAVQRGTLQHEILEGAEAAVFVDDASLDIQVSCRSDAGALVESAPYALVTTLEVAEEIGVPIYDEIRVRVQERVRVTPAS